LPKGVINTHGMLTANQQQARQVWPFVTEQPLVLVDWLPWSHTFGGNHNFNLVLRCAGTLYIDTGKPLPGLIEQTARNLKEISPTIYFNVPAGYGALLPFLETNSDLTRSFFTKLRLIFYAGAALPRDLWQRLEAVSVCTIGRRVPMTSSWGTTETAPLATAAHFLLEGPGNIGVPVAGVELKLVPNASKLEIRVPFSAHCRGHAGLSRARSGAAALAGQHRASITATNFFLLHIRAKLFFHCPNRPWWALLLDGNR
jgi:feruloyl-CoA synthase